MQITGNNSIQNNIFDGHYSVQELPFDPSMASFWQSSNINPSGVTGVPVYFHSGNVLIDSGYLLLQSGAKFSIESGISSSPSDVSGYVYYRINTPIYGVCHGVGRDANVWFTGFNFYNGFHPEGYFSPPFGQNLTVLQMNEDGTTALAENGSCSSLTSTEYNDLFGIVSNTDAAIEASTDSLSANSTSFINSPAIACPQDLSVTFYWHEKQYKIIGGTAGAIAGNTFFNGNPIPTSLDNFNQKTSLRYSATDITPVPAPTINNGDGTTSTQKTFRINFDASGHPIPGYATSGGSNLLNNISNCPGLLAEGETLIGTQQHSLLLNMPDSLGEPSKGAFDYFNWWNIWHFLFKENSDGFPFTNSYDNGGDNFGLAKTPYGNGGSQLFEAQLSNDQYYWDRRQCPEIINFLPHTFGGAIYACPSYYFDVPYYAARKKFGFYGTRFLNGCVSLELDYPLSGRPTSINAVDLDYRDSGSFVYSLPDGAEPAPDKGINWSFGAYSNLLKIAAAEEGQTDFYALNKEFFFWANSGLIASSPEYASLSGNVEFLALFNNLANKYKTYFPSGTGDFVQKSSLVFESGDSSTIYNTGIVYDFLSNNSSYKIFKDSLNGVLIEPLDVYNFASLEKNYGSAVLVSSGVVASDFYHQLETNKQSRIKTRYLENFVKGNPVDLFPTNKIYFGYDNAAGLINGSGWGKATNGFGANQNLADSGINIRYFLGAYGNGEDVSGIKNINSLTSSSFYPGYFDAGIGVDLPLPSYSPVLSGHYNSGGHGNVGLSGNWLAVGYNGIGQLNNNFSCFTPIFIQQPFNTTYCKIGQSPTFRALAVDYHTIPEDKMNIRYPEIVYWTKKLKLVDSSYKNLYPLTYKWYRIDKDSCSNDFKNFLLNPDFSLLEPSNPTGTWCALEGDGPYCTLIHPTECNPVFTPNGAWDFKYRNTPMYEIAKKNNFYMPFKKGATADDANYYYFCMARGRFGIRISEPSELFVENWLKFDVSIQNGGNVPLAPQIKFLSSDGHSVECNPVSVPSYGGFARDKDSIPEDVVEEQLPPPNRGYGDVFSYKFVGMWGYRGSNQTYSPGTLNDTRGLKETWGRMLHYGQLTQYTASLDQTAGDFLYGRNHLPICDGNHTMPTSQDGIKVVVDGVVHWANMQTAIVDTDGRYGVKWDKLGNAGELYVPSTSVANAGQTTISPGIGQWQWGNNLGTIHSFGWNSPQSDLAQSPYQLSPSDFQKLKKNLLNGGVLAGDNCGWHKNGLGRNMLYWIEGFSSFYLYCDPLKKKNVTNYNYMGPALRQTNSSMQYFWMGKPNNSYLDRYPLFGPYAYEWKVRKHNRDRNGNGVSEGFYSYGWGQNYTMQYDAPAIYGLFMKYKESARDVNGMNAARITALGDGAINVKSIRFGFTNGDGGAYRYGNVWLGDINSLTPSPALSYVLSGSESFATTPEFNKYGCSDEDLLAGRCFDPCLSMRYQFGFLPGGKRQNMAPIFNPSVSASQYRIVANSPVVGGSPVGETHLNGDGQYFRGAFGTPHLTYLKAHAGHTLSSQELNGMSPCFDGGADHCNYITPTLNFGSSVYSESQSSSFLSNANLATQSINIPV